MAVYEAFYNNNNISIVMDDTYVYAYYNADTTGNTTNWILAGNQARGNGNIDFLFQDGNNNTYELKGLTLYNTETIQNTTEGQFIVPMIPSTTTCPNNTTPDEFQTQTSSSPYIISILIMLLLISIGFLLIYKGSNGLILKVKKGVLGL